MNFQWISKLTYTLSFKSTSFVENDLPEKRKMLHFDLNMIERESKYWIWNLSWFQACVWAFMFCSAIPKLFYWFLTFYTVTIKYWTKEQENHNFLFRICMVSGLLSAGPKTEEENRFKTVTPEVLRTFGEKKKSLKNDWMIQRRINDNKCSMCALVPLFELRAKYILFFKRFGLNIKSRVIRITRFIKTK